MLIAITVVQLLAALVLILIVLFQSGKSQGLSGAIGGIADSYMSKGKARTIDAKLAKATKWCWIAWLLPVCDRSNTAFEVNRNPPEAGMLRADFYIREASVGIPYSALSAPSMGYRLPMVIRSPAVEP